MVVFQIEKLAQYFSGLDQSFRLEVVNHLHTENPRHNLPEHSDILEILFQFSEPPSESRNFRQPNIVELEFTVFFGTAGASEKQMINEYPLEVLNHSVSSVIQRLKNLYRENGVLKIEN
ncbi:hypothetical protein BDN70DRAFT_939018 [Pholiota conissans]|uniref:Uncharacterized protein n=1 Tax=Pholiota conissans TaxID=109636 RepID=A0A9P5YLH7_9AGAR|nr:hypothetical protein BDN70DRAFT_939018 [Pholiota conissans]